MSERVNLGSRIIGTEARAKQVKAGARKRAQLGTRILGLTEEVVSTASPSQQAQESKSLEQHLAPMAGETVREVRARIMAEGSDLLAIETAERERKDGPRKGVLAALEEEHERRRTTKPDDYQGEDGDDDGDEE